MQSLEFLKSVENFGCLMAIKRPSHLWKMEKAESHWSISILSHFGKQSFHSKYPIISTVGWDTPKVQRKAIQEW